MDMNGDNAIRTLILCIVTYRSIHTMSVWGIVYSFMGIPEPPFK